MTRKAWMLLVGVVLVAGHLQALQAQGGGVALARLRGFEEVPALSSPGGGIFSAILLPDATAISWELTYFNVPNDVTQAHLHFAQKGVNGGIMVFLCTNLGNHPTAQACPESPTTISGGFTGDDIGTGASGQGIGPGAFGALVRALRNGVVYANVHTVKYPGGEIRGQLEFHPVD